MTDRAQDTRPIVHSPHCTKPDVVNICKCGANRCCKTCRWGSGQMPCECSPARGLRNA